MRCLTWIGLRTVTIFIIATAVHQNQAINRRSRTAGDNQDETKAPILGPQINLETIEGVEQVTRLVLIKTDSLPAESAERIDGRYLSSLMETLYTGLRKPFKSVSADILGIFPSFEEVQVRCQEANFSQTESKDKSVILKRRFLDENEPGPTEEELNQAEWLDEEIRNETKRQEPDMNNTNQDALKSTLQVCRAVTSNCLSMEELVDMLPPNIVTFDRALVRLCPVMLFRIMNQICHRAVNSLATRSQDRLISAYKADKSAETADGKSSDPKRDTIALNNLIRETQILRNLQSSEDLSSKRPQKLHKKLKTQVSYKSNGGLDVETLGRQGRVDEELMRIRLKLTEPSIEKVWIFSLLFVILSIVVSMGGLIVLPFVKKTTRRRILTLFEGLAVGGLAGSATLHMFPQAFGLVDENYHKYFWRIFVVFLGIYVCYLCERIIKILKVVRARMKRRSCASLHNLDLRYGIPPLDLEVSRDRLRFDRSHEDYNYSSTNQSSSYRKRSSGKSVSRDMELEESCKNCIEARYLHNQGESFGSPFRDKTNKSVSPKYQRHERRHPSGLSFDSLQFTNNPTDLESVDMDNCQSYATRHRLIHCLRSVQSQFSPVYVVQNQNQESPNASKETERSSRISGFSDLKDKSSKPRLGHNLAPRFDEKKRIRMSSILKILKFGKKSSAKKYQKQREVETRLYHQHLSSRIGGHYDPAYLNRGASVVDDVAAERQDQDNAARMSVDTVAWMIVFGDAVLNVIDGLSIGAAFERNILAGISISVAVMLEEVTHRLGTFAVLIRAGMSMQQSLLCTFLSACALFPGLIVGILLSDATEDATPYIFCAAGGIFLYMVSFRSITVK